MSSRMPVGQRRRSPRPSPRALADAHAVAVADAEARGGLRMQFRPHLGLRREQLGHPPGLRARLVVLEQPAGDQGQLARSRAPGRGPRARHGHEPGAAVLVPEPVEEQARRPGRPGRDTASAPRSSVSSSAWLRPE